MKSFQSEIIHCNRRKGSESRAWGALASRDGGFWACVPVAPGSFRRQRIGGPFPTAEEASAVARGAMRQKRRRVSVVAVPHLNAYGELCHCTRI